jgi:hypothetical protein
MGRPPIGDRPMTPAERQRRVRAITKPASVTAVLMSRAEQHDLLMLIRARERVAISDAREHQATLLANFQRKLAARYRPEDHPVWKEAHAAATRAGAEAQAKMAATFRELGIPEEWAPKIAVEWYGRGENAMAARRAELQKVATSEAERRLRAAETAIKKASVEAQERIVAAGLTSEAARAMLAAMPTVEQLMPELEVDAIERIAAPDRRGRHRPISLADY